MSNLEGTEHVKEGEKNRQEAVKREWRAGAHQQKAEEVQHKAAEEKVEHKEHERQEWACEECKEKERWEAIKAACWAVVMEAENVCARKVIAYSPTTGANIEMLLQTEGGDRGTSTGWTPLPGSLLVPGWGNVGDGGISQWGA
ncbi:hypothetical protein EDD16DRAFT_1519702 [Pisolithus croceorrhizus]|nr:hypothetical protein EV401DRAFT_1890958 [Pisolithus croceorrhizus]KAI6118679.1 hypothetical protein EDD16DRAFT_1519702 [Pisolithus croceorrhizus]